MNYIIINGNENFYVLIAENSYYPFTYGIHPDDLEEFKNACESLSDDEDSVVLILKYHGCVEGNYQVYEVIITPNLSSSGAKIGYNVQMLNLLTVKSVYRRNVNNVKKYRTYMSMINVYYFEYEMVTNIFKIFVYIHEKSYLIVCEDLGAWYESTFAKLGAEKDKIALQKFYKALKSGRSDFTIHISGAFFSDDDKVDDYICRGKTMSMQDGDRVYGIIKNQEEHIEKFQAYYNTEAGRDSATGLLNKRASKEYSKDLLAEGSSNRRYMIVIDIDDFKDFNDNYGHLFGDDVILTVARVLSNAVNIRGIVGRIGGDEFYILTENIDSERDLRFLLKTICKNLYYAYGNKMEDVHITASIGVSCYPDDGTDYDLLFKKADKSLYIAKEKGKNRYIIYNEEKHGAVLGDGVVETVEKFNPVLKAEACANEISKFAIKLALEGINAVDEVLAGICDAFAIDGICVFTKEGEMLYNAGQSRVLPDIDFSFLESDGYRGLYSDFSVLAVNDLRGTEKYSKELYEAVNAVGVISFLHVAYPDKDNSKLYMFYDVFTGKRKWSYEDRNYLMIISNMILDIICKDRGL